jgi:hypothetical protein
MCPSFGKDWMIQRFEKFGKLIKIRMFAHQVVRVVGNIFS